MSKQSWDDPANEVKSNWVKFNVPLEDKVMGTLTGKRQVDSQIPGQIAKKINVYDLKIDEGTYHTLDEKKKVIDQPITLSKGDFASVSGTTVIDRQMMNVKVGQKIGFKFIEEVPAKQKGFAPAKVIKVYVLKNDDGSPLMDPEYASLSDYAAE